VHEAGLRGYEVTSWNGILVPAATPKEVITRLNVEINKAMKASDTREQFLGMGMDALPSTPEHFTAYIREETDKWARVIRASGAKLD
jgi:tripartite-type tricarboxylate transporter receptor subunit TctC